MKLIAIGSAILLFTLPAWAGTFIEDFDNNFGVRHASSVTPKAKLATVWGSLKRF